MFTDVIMNFNIYLHIHMSEKEKGKHRFTTLHSHNFPAINSSLIERQQNWYL